MQQFNKQRDFCSRYWACAVLSVIPLSMYTLGISTVTLSEWIMILGMPLLIICGKITVSINENLKSFLYFILLVFMITIFSHTIQMNFKTIAIVRNIRLAMHVLFIVVACSIIDHDIFLKTLRLLTIIAAVYIILQYLAYHVAGIYFSSRLLPLPTSREMDIDTLLTQFSKYYFRATGFFNEPSYAAKFLIPGFAYYLFDWDAQSGRVNYFGTVLLISCFLILTSVQGIMCMLFMIVFRVFVMVRQRVLSQKQVLYSLALILSGVILYRIFSSQKGFTFISERFTELFNLNFEAGRSSSFRLVRGYLVFAQLPILYRIIGIGYGGLIEYVLENNITTILDSSIRTSSTAGYVNGVSLVLCSAGILGFFAFVYMMGSIYKKSDDITRCIIVSYILLMLSGGAIFDLTMVFYFCLIVKGQKANVMCDCGGKSEKI